MISQPVAVVGGKQHEGVVAQAECVQLDENAAHIVIDETDHPVVIGDQVTQLLVALLGRARVTLPEAA